MALFARTALAFGVATLLAVGSMLRYPGGTPSDPPTAGYSIHRNFLSDLGMTVAYDGRTNLLGASLFVVSVVLVVAATGAVLFAFVRRCSTSDHARRFARSAGALGAVACLAFLGIAFTPENRVMRLHVDLTMLVFRIAPIVTLLFTVAMKGSGAFHPRAIQASAMLTIVLVAYVVLLEWGPAVTTPDGLVVQAVAQKLVTGAFMIAVLVASFPGTVKGSPVRDLPRRRT